MSVKLNRKDLIHILGNRILPFAGIITPATLLVNPSTAQQRVVAPVRRLSVEGNQTSRFTYSVPADGPGSNLPASEIFLGPRTVVSRYAAATASLGDILPIAP